MPKKKKQPVTNSETLTKGITTSTQNPVEDANSVEAGVLTVSEYQEFTATTDKYPKHLSMLCHVLGLSSEVGEVQGKLKKLLRGDYEGKPENEWKEAFTSEMGDVLWYITRLCSDVDITLQDLMQQNKDKLTKRMETNTIKGDGDKREEEATQQQQQELPLEEPSKSE